MNTVKYNTKTNRNIIGKIISTMMVLAIILIVTIVLTTFFFQSTPVNNTTNEQVEQNVTETVDTYEENVDLSEEVSCIF